MSPEMLTLIISSITFVIACYLIWRQGSVFDFQNLSAKMTEAKPVAMQLIELAKTGTAAAEMLANTGKLPKDDKFKYALDYVLSLLPPDHRFTRDQVVGAIEAGAFLADTIGKTVANGKPTEERP